MPELRHRIFQQCGKCKYRRTIARFAEVGDASVFQDLLKWNMRIQEELGTNKCPGCGAVQYPKNIKRDLVSVVVE